MLVHQEGHLVYGQRYEEALVHQNGLLVNETVFSMLPCCRRGVSWHGKCYSALLYREVTWLGNREYMIKVSFQTLENQKNNRIFAVRKNHAGLFNILINN